MKILMINEVCGHTSTGKICTDIAVRLEESGHTVKIAYGRDDYVPKQYRRFAFRIGDFWSVRLHALSARFFDNCGFGSKRVTKRFLKWVDEYRPDVIHLHNLHGYYISVPLLFEYIKEHNIRTVWTLHDCWPLTGHCPGFEYVNCDKWETGCENCPQKRRYPASFFADNSRENYSRKKELFSGVKDMTIVSPSLWLKETVGKSILQEYPCVVINNGIDMRLFCPTDSNLRKEYCLENKTVLLGVASVWDKLKGIEAFFELAGRLSDDFRIVLIGLTKKQISKAPDNIICIEKTKDIHEMAKWYSAADYFINPTLEDNYPSVNLEAIACGTPVISFPSGGSPESAEIYGTSTGEKSIEKLVEIIESQRRFERKPVSLDAYDMAGKYLELYGKRERLV